MSFVIASPAVSKPIDKRVTSKSSRCRTCEDPSPMRMAACTAAPKSSAKGGDDVYLRHDPLNDCHLKALHSRLHGADGVLISKEHGHQNDREWDRHIDDGKKELVLGHSFFSA